MIPYGVIWAGYTMVWYGWTLLQDKQVGFTDLILPSRIAKVEALLSASSTAAPAIPSYVQSPGVQPGSAYYPPNPQGGLPSKPPLGSTPPAYYG